MRTACVGGCGEEVSDRRSEEGGVERARQLCEGHGTQREGLQAIPRAEVGRALRQEHPERPQLNRARVDTEEHDPRIDARHAEGEPGHQGTERQQHANLRRESGRAVAEQLQTP
jgi:hypothetical protein